jgi:hypothetical protein
MYSLLPAFVSALFLLFGTYVLVTQGVTRVSIPFVLMCATTFGWQGTWAFLFQATSVDVANLFAKTGYAFGMSEGRLWVALGLTESDRCPKLGAYE